MIASNSISSHQPKPRGRSSSGWKSAGALIGILLLFALLSLGTTLVSHFFGQNYLQGDEFLGDAARWGSVSDWFSGVVGVSIGLAGSAITIWLAYRVEKLTVAQNQMANVQAWRETYIDSGDITARAELAAHAYELIQRIYVNLIAIEKIDKDFDRGEEELENAAREVEKDASQEIRALLNETYQKAEPNREKIIETLTDMVALLPKLLRKDLMTEDVLCLSSEQVEGFAEACMHGNDIGGHHSHQLAERIRVKAPARVHVADAVNLLLTYSKKSRMALKASGYRSADYQPDDFSEFYWRHDAKSPGDALLRYENYLPLARCNSDSGARPISWARAYCDFVMDEVNPYRYAREAIINDLQIGDVSPRQEKRLEMLSNLAINKVLDSSPYIRDLYPSSGYEQKVKAIKVEYPLKRPVDPDDVPVRPKVKLKRNRIYLAPKRD